MKTYDVILLGTGQATGTILPELLQQKKSVAIVEEDRVGGTCVNWGCTPTKTLVASARVAHVVRTSGDFGVNVPTFQVDFPKVMQRMNAMRNAGAEGFESWLRDATDFYAGHGQFISPHEIQIGDEVIYGHSIYIHTGTRSLVPDIEGLSDVPFLDNKGLLALEKLPEHLIILGGSYIALEFAQIFRRFGSKVTVIQRSAHLISREDADFALSVQKVLESEGIEFHLDTRLERIAPHANGVQVFFRTAGTTESTVGSHLLVALGRVPNSDALGLESAGVTRDAHGYIKTDDYLRTNVPHIYALGDVNGKGAFTHTSVNDGQVLLSDLSNKGWKVSDRIPIHAMFIDPPLARVGMTESDARTSGRTILMALCPMDTISRAKEKGETAGFIKILVDQQTQKIVGATIFGVDGDEIINMIAVFMQTGLPYTELQRTVLVHPTVAELVPWILNDLKPLVS